MKEKQEGRKKKGKACEGKGTKGGGGVQATATKILEAKRRHVRTPLGKLLKRYSQLDDEKIEKMQKWHLSLKK